jgi:hypothetical protein
MGSRIFVLFSMSHTSSTSGYIDYTSPTSGYIDYTFVGTLLPAVTINSFPGWPIPKTGMFPRPFWEDLFQGIVRTPVNWSVNCKSSYMTSDRGAFIFYLPLFQIFSYTIRRSLRQSSQTPKTPTSTITWGMARTKSRTSVTDNEACVTYRPNDKSVDSKSRPINWQLFCLPCDIRMNIRIMMTLHSLPNGRI